MAWSSSSEDGNFSFYFIFAEKKKNQNYQQNQMIS